MREEAKADVSDLRSEVGQLKKAEAAQKQPHSPQAPQAAVSPQQTRPQAPQVPPAAPQLDSLIVSSFPPLFDGFRGKRFVLLWRGSRDGFRARDFHGQCDGHANTLTLILDKKTFGRGNIFGGFTPLEWESRVWNGKYNDEDNRWKCDDSLKSFLFTLKNPQNTLASKFALKAERKQYAILCDSSQGPAFGGIGISNDCNANTDSGTYLGEAYTTGVYKIALLYIIAHPYFLRRHRRANILLGRRGDTKAKP
jgi:hypothetical protein